MRGSQTSLRAAFWAMLAAVAMSLFLVISDPYAVRQSILKRERAPAGRSARAVLIAQADPSGSTPATVEPTSVPPTTDREASETVLGGDKAVLTEEPTAVATARTWSVSSGEADQQHGNETPRPPRRGSAMPILSPGRLGDAQPRGEFVALPPPPDLRDDVSSPAVADMSRSRVEFNHGLDDSLAQQLHSLQRRQTEIIQLQHAGLDRLDELADEIRQTSLRMDSLLERRQAAEFPQGPSF